MNYRLGRRRYHGGRGLAAFGGTDGIVEGETTVDELITGVGREEDDSRSEDTTIEGDSWFSVMVTVGKADGMGGLLRAEL